MVAVPRESGETDAQTFPARLGQLTSPRRNFHRESEAGLFLPMIPSHFIRLGDCLDVLKTMPDNSVDSIVTDPPYGLSFMGKKWDYDVPSTEIWAECLRVLKPGGHLLAFAGTRTQHRMAVRIEDAGFEIRDMIAWVYGSGFPKSLDISKQFDKAAGVEGDREFLCVNPASRSGNSGSEVIGETATTATGWRKPIRPDKTTPASAAAQQWAGWGTALKPAMEPITVARKPPDGTVAANVLEWGTGGLNINGCRVEFQCDSDKDSAKPQGKATTKANGAAAATPDAGRGIERIEFPIKQHAAGRWPANIIHDGSQMVMDLFPAKAGAAAPVKRGFDGASNGIYGDFANKGDDGASFYDDSGSAARFFYCAKASRSERDAGCEDMDHVTAGEITGGREEGSAGLQSPRAGAGRTAGGKNIHPTVKPLALMRYLVRLVTPPGGTTLDPFLGSGTTALAALQEGFSVIGIERDEHSHKTAMQRILNR